MGVLYVKINAIAECKHRHLTLWAQVKPGNSSKPIKFAGSPQLTSNDYWRFKTIKGKQSDLIIEIKHVDTFRNTTELASHSFDLAWYPRGGVVSGWYPFMVRGSNPIMVQMTVHRGTHGQKAFKGPASSLLRMPPWMCPPPSYAPCPMPVNPMYQVQPPLPAQPLPPQPYPPQYAPQYSPQYQQYPPMNQPPQYAQQFNNPYELQVFDSSIPPTM